MENKQKLLTEYLDTQLELFAEKLHQETIRLHKSIVKDFWLMQFPITLLFAVISTISFIGWVFLIPFDATPPIWRFFISLTVGGATGHCHWELFKTISEFLQHQKEHKKFEKHIEEHHKQKDVAVKSVERKAVVN